MNIPADVETIESYVFSEMLSRLRQLSAFQIGSKCARVFQCVPPAKLFESNWGKIPIMDLFALLRSQCRGFDVYWIGLVK
jgi:hypothetical protein